MVPKKQNGACVTSMGKHGECGTWGGQTCGSSARLVAGGKCECDTGGGETCGYSVSWYVRKGMLEVGMKEVG